MKDPSAPEFATPSPAEKSGRGRLLAPQGCLFALWAAHTALVIADGHMSPERMNIRGLDPTAYYSYFHSLYFDHDWEFANQYALFGQGYAHGARTATGRTENHSSIGPALALAPFWIGADAVARFGGWPDDGNSKPYHIAGFVGLGIYGLAALLLLGLWGMRHFGRWAGAWAAGLTWGFSTLLYYTYPETIMPHIIGAAAAALFFLAVGEAPPDRRGERRGFSAPPLAIEKAPQSRGRKDRRGEAAPLLRAAALMGAALGLAMLMRWQNFLFVLYPATLSARRVALCPPESRLGQLRREARYWAIAAVAGLVAFSPQMIAWQILFGRPLAAPQGGQYFFPWRIEALRVLFSTHNGLLTLTPGVALCVAGLFFAPRPLRPHALGMGLALLAQLYLNSTVLDWHGAWGFGSRRFTESAPIFVFGFAALLAWRPSVRWRRSLVGLGAALVIWNELFVYQFVFHLISWDSALTAHEIFADKFHLRDSLRRRLLVETARTLYDEGDVTGSLEAIQLGINIDPQHDDLYEMLGLIYADLGKYPAALEAYDHALKLRPGTNHTLELRAEAVAKLAESMGLGKAPASSPGGANAK